MTFLKKLGLVLAKATQVITGIDPLLPFLANGDRIDAVQNRVLDTLTQVAGVVVSIEAVGVALKLDGPQKLTAAAPLVSQLIRQSSLVTGKKIADPLKFDAAVAEITSGVVALLNSLHEDDVKTA